MIIRFGMEGFMVFSIVWWNNARVISTLYRDNPAEAVAYAKEHFPLEQHFQISTSVEVVDEDHHVIFEMDINNAQTMNDRKKPFH
jgi:hypothetical protein